MILYILLIVLGLGLGYFSYQTWLLKHRQVSILPGQLTDKILLFFKLVMDKVELRDREQNGEWKRAQVYSRLIKDFPSYPRWVIARGIEEIITREKLNAR